LLGSSKQLTVSVTYRFLLTAPASNSAWEVRFFPGCTFVLATFSMDRDVTSALAED